MGFRQSVELGRARALLSGFLAVGLLASASIAQAAEVKEGAKAPNIVGKNINSGKKVSLAEMVKKNKLTIVDFWASWCKPCKKELPFLGELHKDYGKKGLGIIGVNIDKNPKARDKFLKGKDINFPIVYDEKGAKFPPKYGPPTMPTSYVLDSKGKVIYRHVGFRSGDKKDFMRLIKKHL